MFSIIMDEWFHKYNLTGENLLAFPPTHINYENAADKDGTRPMLIFPHVVYITLYMQNHIFKK